MSTHKHIDLICVAVLVFTLILTVLFLFGERLGIQVVRTEEEETAEESAWFTVNDLNADWSTTGTTVITLKGDTARVSGQGAYAYGGDVIITGGGWFTVTGSLDDGSIIVDAKNTSKVWIQLNGADISCSDDACLQVLEAEKVFLTIAEGTENSFSSGSAYSEEALEAGRSGAVYAADDMTINGSGSLSITAAYRHGIEANDDLVITGGVLTIDAAADGLNVNDSLRIREADVTISAADDGVAVKAEDSYFYMESGSLTITCEDDAIHTAGDFTLAGGDLVISTGDDGIHSDTLITVLDGTILIDKCYEGIEAVRIDVQGGDITIYPTDDGFSANGVTLSTAGALEISGTEITQAETAVSDQDTADTAAPESSKDTETWIHISGGSILIINESGIDADGLDSNGDVIITGGDIRISLPGTGNNKAIDVAGADGGVAQISGGTLVASGSDEKAKDFDSSSSQRSILYPVSGGAEAGTMVRLEDQEGSVLLSYEVPVGFTCLTLSSPELTTGETYRVVVGDQSEEITLEAPADSNDSEPASGSRIGDEPLTGTDLQTILSAVPETEDEEQTGEPVQETVEKTVEYTAETWYYTGAAFLVILLGLAVVGFYRRR